MSALAAHLSDWQAMGSVSTKLPILSIVQHALLTVTGAQFSKIAVPKEFILREHFSLLLQLYVQPARAMSGILDRGNWLLGVITAVALSFALSFLVAPAAPHMPHGPHVPEAPPLSPVAVLQSNVLSATTALTVFCIFVPLAIAFVCAFERLGHFTTVLSRDFAPVLACCSLAWTAALVPVAIAVSVAGQATWQLWVGAAAALYFLVLTAIALSVVFGAGPSSSSASVLLSTAATLFVIVSGVFHVIIGLVASPLFLLYGFWYFSGSFQSLGQGLRSRQSFRRTLEAAAVNPHDADAQSQLGLIYQGRRQFDQATQRFRRALEIDPREPEALLQLGRILRDRAQYPEALKHFQALAKIDPKYSSHEVWREAGSVYVATGRFTDARPVLEHYIQHRPYDAEALFYLGRTLEALNDRPGAADAYSRSVEAAATAPPHRRRFVSRWGRQAQRRLRDLKKNPSLR